MNTCQTCWWYDSLEIDPDENDKKDVPVPNEKLVALMQNNPTPKVPMHTYEQETDSGIGFCKVCYSDDKNDGNHF